MFTTELVSEEDKTLLIFDLAKIDLAFVMPNIDEFSFPSDVDILVGINSCINDERTINININANAIELKEKADELICMLESRNE
jgi:hypothetical protein